MKYGRYEVIKELGRGTMGVVYLAHDPKIGRNVALKVVHQERLTDKDLIDRFHREAKVVGILSHPNIVTIYDVGEDHGTIFIVMEFIEGQALKEVIKSESLNREQIADLGIQAAEALDYSHQKGIVHRDIKPSNIILQPDGQIKITDFGIARLEDTSVTKQTQTGQILGTPAYMSPEQALGDKVDGRADLFSLGIILYELLTGTRPFSGKSLGSMLMAIVQKAHPDPVTLKPDLPDEFSRIITCCLNKSPDKRFQTGKDLADALRNAIRRKPVESPVITSSPKIKKGIILFLFILLTGLIVPTLLHIFPQFIPSKVPLMVQSEPDGADIYVDGSRKGLSPLAIHVAKGTHRLQITKSGYQSWEDEILVETDKIEPLSVELSPISGILAITSQPAGAEVFINDKLKGMTADTPLEIQLPIGTYQVRISMPDYYPWKEEIFIEKEEIKPLSITLSPIPAHLTVMTHPPGAEVFINDQFKGNTTDSPLEIQLPLGEYTLRVAKKGYQTREKVIVLNELKKYPVEVKLPLKSGKIQIRSTPAGADVYVKGSLRGKTPLLLKLPLGTHQIRLTKEGYHSGTKSFQLKGKTTHPLNIRLSPIIVFLKVDSKPDGARVYVDEVFKGRTPLHIEVSRTRHQLRLVHPPDIQWERSIDLLELKENSSFCINVNLKTGWGHAFKCDQ